MATSLICDNEGIVKCIKKYTYYDTKHITPDMTEAVIILPTIHVSKQLSYNLEWHRGHIDRRQEDRQKWTTQEAANVAIDEYSGTSVGGRLRSNTAPPNRPTLSPLKGDTNDTPRWISIRQLGANYTRSNNNY